MNSVSEIKFYDKNCPYYEFSNFWGTHNDKKFSLYIDDRYWPSTEHYYQSQKYSDKLDNIYYKEYFNLIASAPTPNKCFILATQRIKSGYAAKWIYSKSNPITLNEIVNKYLNKGVKMRNDWNKIKDYIMLKALRFKFKQNKHLKKLLLNTGNALLIEHTKRDCYWGDGGDGTGQSKLGLLLMKVRNELNDNHNQNNKKKRKMYHDEEEQQQINSSLPPKKKQKLLSIISDDDEEEDDDMVILNNDHNKNKKKKDINNYKVEQLMIAADTNDMKMCEKILITDPKLINMKYSKIGNVVKQSPYNIGTTGIVYAVRSGHDKMVNILISKYMADIHVKDDENWNLLHYSCLAGHYGITKLLLEMGVDQKLICKFRKCTPRMIAEYKRWNDIVAIFKGDKDNKDGKQYEYTMKEKEDIFKKTRKRLDGLAGGKKKGLNGNKINNLSLYLHRYQIDWSIYNALKKNLCGVDMNTIAFKCIDTQLKLLYDDDGMEDGSVWMVIYHDRLRMHQNRGLFEDTDGMRVIRSGSISKLDHILVIKTEQNDDKMINTLRFIIGEKVEIVVDNIDDIDDRKDDDDDVNTDNGLKTMSKLNDDNTNHTKQIGKCNNIEMKKRKELLDAQRERIWGTV